MATTHCKTTKAKSASHHIIDCDIDDMWVRAIDTPPPEYKRFSDFKEKWKLKERQTQRRLYRLLDAGKVVAKKFYVLRRDGKPDNITHYKIL